MIDKSMLLAVLRERLRADLAALERRQRDTQQGATHEESRAEHAKDTRATEQSYLARGLAERVEDLRRTTEAISTFAARDFAADAPIAVGALVVLSSEETEPGDEPRRTSAGADAPPASPERWLLVPGAGGVELTIDGIRVLTLTPVSPLGQALLGLRVGDEGAVRTPRGERCFEVLAVG